MSEPFYSRARLLTALREGVRSGDWQQYAKSSNSFRVRIHNLREQGYGIVNLPDKRRDPRGQPVIYKLIYNANEPTRCPTCGRPS